MGRKVIRNQEADKRKKNIKNQKSNENKKVINNQESAENKKNKKSKNINILDDEGINKNKPDKKKLIICFAAFVVLVIIAAVCHLSYLNKKYPIKGSYLDNMQFEKYTFKYGKFTYRFNTTDQVSEDDGVKEGTWTLEGDKLTLKFSGKSGATLVYIYDKESDTFYMEGKENERYWSKVD